MAIKILHIEDNQLDAELIHTFLAKEQPCSQIVHVKKKQEFVEKLTTDMKKICQFLEVCASEVDD